MLWETLVMCRMQEENCEHKTVPCFSSLYICYMGSWYGSGLWAGQPGFDSWQGREIFLFAMSRRDLGPTQPPVLCVLGAICPRVMQPGHEADHSPPYSAEGQLYLSYVLLFIIFILFNWSWLFVKGTVFLFICLKYLLRWILDGMDN
jgi:hypothetical protein